SEPEGAGREQREVDARLRREDVVANVADALLAAEERALVVETARRVPGGADVRLAVLHAAGADVARVPAGREDVAERDAEVEDALLDRAAELVDLRDRVERVGIDDRAGAARRRSEEAVEGEDASDVGIVGDRDPDD